MGILGGRGPPVWFLRKNVIPRELCLQNAQECDLKDVVGRWNFERKRFVAKEGLTGTSCKLTEDGSTE